MCVHFQIGKYVLEKARMLKLKDEYCEQALRFEEMAGTTAAVPETRRENGSNSDGVDDDASLEEVANGSRRMRSGSYVVEAHGFQLIFQRPAGSELT